MKKTKYADLEMRNLSEKAQKFYAETSPLTVTYTEADGEKLFTVTGCFEFSELTFDELNAAFEDLFNEFSEIPEDDE